MNLLFPVPQIDDITLQTTFTLVEDVPTIVVDLQVLANLSYVAVVTILILHSRCVG